MKKKKLSYQQKSGFQVPPNYFGDLEEIMLRKISGPEAGIDNYQASPGFTVPDNYFNSLEERILQNIEKPEEKGRVIPLFKRKSFYYAAAVAAVFIGLLWTNLFKPNVPEYTIDSVELSALENYIDEGYLDLNFNEISAYITEEGNPVENFNASALTDEEVLIYLSENVEDPDLLLE